MVSRIWLFGFRVYGTCTYAFIRFPLRVLGWGFGFRVSFCARLMLGFLIKKMSKLRYLLANYITYFCAGSYYKR